MKTPSRPYIYELVKLSSCHLNHNAKQPSSVRMKLINQPPRMPLLMFVLRRPPRHGGDASDVIAGDAADVSIPSSFVMLSRVDGRFGTGPVTGRRWHEKRRSHPSVCDKNFVTEKHVVCVLSTSNSQRRHHVIMSS